LETLKSLFGRNLASRRGKRRAPCRASDDPPMPTVRGQPRLVYQPALYQRLIDLSPSPSNALEFCVGTIAEMTEGDLYEAVDTYSRQGRIAYIHLRNVRGKVPYYKETFIDDGDVDARRVIGILKRNGFGGLIIPDHAPQMTCAARGMPAWPLPWATSSARWKLRKTKAPDQADPPSEPDESSTDWLCLPCGYIGAPQRMAKDRNPWPAGLRLSQNHPRH